MKNSISFYIYISVLLLFFSHCSINRSIKARELLSKCEFSIKNVEVKEVISSKESDLLSLFNKFISGEKKGLPIVNVNVVVNVENPNDENVIIDSLSLFLVVEEDSLTKIDVNSYTEIEAKSSKNVPVYISLPMNRNILKATTAKEFTLKGTVWMKIEIFSGYTSVFAYPLEMTKNI